MDGFVASAAGINGQNGWLVLTGAGEQVSASTEAHGRVRALKALPKSLLHPVTDEKTGSELVARHAELIGRVTLMWNDVHAQAGQLFQDFCASAEARKRYSETQNDRIQRQLLLSVGSVALEKYPDLRERLEKTLTELDLLAGDRNAAIHTYWAVDLPTGKILAHRRSPPHKRLRADFEEQFEGLLEKLSDFWLSLFDLRIDYFDRNARRDQSS
jgi:hypothetical protein